MKRAVVVGAGLAGLTAALRLADNGLDVSILEQRREPGGRVRRINPGAAHAPIDCGQHLMLGCYRETRTLVSRLGTGSLLEHVDNPTPFVSADGQTHLYRPARLPAPLHALPALAGLTHLSLRHRLALGRVAVAVTLGGARQRGALDNMDAACWLNRCGQSAAAIAGFWEPLVLATLNTPITAASALLLATVIEKGLLAGHADGAPMLPRTTLYDLLIKPAVEELRRKGCQILTGHKVAHVLDDGADRMTAVVTTAGKHIEADLFVIAVPSWDVAALAVGRSALAPLARTASGLGSSAIITVNLWFDRPWMRYRMAGMIGDTMHWVFDHPGEEGAGEKTGGRRVSLVISAADRYISEGNGALVDRSLTACQKYFPAARDVRLVSGLVLKSRKATFYASAGQNALRAACRIPYVNARLAGDWTATDLPATIESAIASGNKAVADILQDLDCGGVSGWRCAEAGVSRSPGILSPEMRGPR